MRRMIGAGMAVLGVTGAMVWTAPKVTAQSVSQIVLSCTTPAPESKSTNGCASSQEAPIPSANSNEGLFVGGFWVWCQSPAGASTPYGPDCAGSVYVEELGPGTAVYEATSVDGSASQPTSTTLQVEFTSSDGDLSCTLAVPMSPTKRGTTLSGTCNGVAVTFSDAVVQVTR
jgi:hypothetical protein